MQEKFNRHFENLLNRHHLKDGVFAVGVSGGADSLALALLLKKWGGTDIVALTVNHGLREESAKEAEFVASVMKKHKIKHHILNWEGEKPSVGIEEAARIARYDLLGKWCAENGVDKLFIAHHKLDQAETFLMRLQRGSGVNGLAAMLEVFDKDGIKIIRPLLEFMPEELKDFLDSQKINWVEDPHNFNEDFLRVKIRNFIPRLEKELGLTVERIADTAANMARVRDFLETETGDYLKENLQSFEDIAFALPLASFKNLHVEIALRVLVKIFQKINGKFYAPRLNSLESLYSSALESRFKSATLQNCEVLKFKGKIYFIPEIKEKKVLSKKEWEEFAGRNKRYGKIELPYKLRLCLVRFVPIL